MEKTYRYLPTCLLISLMAIPYCYNMNDFSPWADWWTYDGISGPSFWGLNPAWILCGQGKFQSPIDIKPRGLLYDPSLTNLNLHTKKITGNLTNTGHDVTILIGEEFSRMLNVSMGPLQYKYHIYQVKIHFGRAENRGSEHTVDGEQFPAEIQIFAYNGDLYRNASQAKLSPKGIVIFAIFTAFGFPDNEAFRLITSKIDDIHLKGNVISMNGLPIDMLFPETKHYVTYEGSFTQPGCQESVTWIVFNRPIRILREQMGEYTENGKKVTYFWHLAKFRTLKQGAENTSDLLLERNFRPTMPLHNRVVRTNINLLSPTDTCNMRIRRYYGVNSQFSF